MNSEHSPKDRFGARMRLWIGPAAWVAALCLLLGLGGDSARELLRYEREAIVAGQIWRLLTAHLVHLGWPHLWLNVIAVLILGNLFADVLERSDWWLGLLVSALAIDGGLLLMDRSVQWYVGLSGVLHGIMLLGGLRLLPAHTLLGLGLLAGVIAKLLWEQWQGPLPFTQAAAAGPVLVNAHLFGAVGGLISFGAAWIKRRLGQASAPL